MFNWTFTRKRAG